MATLSVRTTHGGKAARAVLTQNSDAVVRDARYHNINQALWNGMKWALYTTQGVDRVMVGDDQLDRADIIDRLWAYLDGMPGGRSPFGINQTSMMISLLALRPRVERSRL